MTKPEDQKPQPEAPPARPNYMLTVDQMEEIELRQIAEGNKRREAAGLFKPD